VALSSPRFARDPDVKRAADNNPPIRVGARGVAVEILQRALKDLGFSMPHSTKPTGFPDGIFGAETEATVKAFQRANNLAVDGIVGRNTLARLDEIFTAREAREAQERLVAVNAPFPAGKAFFT
jgi:peptidoglycan hydrolase-like protein with peptidoglycan-binding domain